MLLFHLLFQGRHPFAGRYADGEMPIERAIAESRFAYGANNAAVGMSAPPATLALGSFGAQIAELFERAFAAPGGAERPAAIEWIEPLQKLETELAACNLRPRHFHPRDARCCWCSIEEKSGARLFDDDQVATAESTAVTARQLWEAIEGVRAPPPVTELPPQSLENFLAADSAKEVFMQLAAAVADKVPIFAVAGLFLAIQLFPDWGFLVGSVIGAAVYVGAKVFKRRFTRFRALARAEWNRAIANWKALSSAKEFFRARANLEEWHRALLSVDERLIMELDKVRLYHEPRQRQAFLDGFNLEDSMLLSVTHEEIAALQERGIRSAYDVIRQSHSLFRVVQSTGLGELRRWAEQCGAQFRFDPREAGYRASVEAIEANFREQRQTAIDALRRGPEVLAATRDEIQVARARAEGDLQQVREKMRRMRESA